MVAGALLVEQWHGADAARSDREVVAHRDSGTSLLHQTPRSVRSTRVRVIDGDTVRSDGQVYRLVGFDAPETGRRAACDRERTLGDAATRRLRDLVAAGDIDLRRVPCACPPGTEGTRRCNFGRRCGTLKARGQDVGTILIAEGLARQYTCSGTGCPRRGSWCS